MVAPNRTGDRCAVCGYALRDKGTCKRCDAQERLMANKRGGY